MELPLSAWNGHRNGKLYVCSLVRSRYLGLPAWRMLLTVLELLNRFELLRPLCGRVRNAEMSLLARVLGAFGR